MDPSNGVRKVYHGVRKVYHGVRKVYHGVRKVYHTDRKVNLSVSSRTYMDKCLPCC